jgi:endo-1,4-beta-xylanase
MAEIKCSRRELLAGLALSAGVLRAADAPARCLVYDHEGQPLPASGFERFHLCDLLMRPFTVAVDAVPGEVRFTPPADRPFRMGMPLLVPGFGNVFVYADDGGDGYTARSLTHGKPQVLNHAFARDRLATVRKLASECKHLGVAIPPEARRRIEAAEAELERAEIPHTERSVLVRACMASLRDSLWAGEMLVVARAQHNIARQPARPGFLFGCNGFALASGTSALRERFGALFNYATLPLYRSLVEPQLGHRDYSAFEGGLDAIAGTKIVPKGHPLIFLVPDSTPAWLKNISYDETKRACLSYVHDTIERFRPRVHIWDVVNEAHVQPELGRGMEGFTRELNVDLTVQALRTAHEADSNCFRIVNNTGTWSEYYMSRNPAPWQQSPYDYLAMLREAKADFEAIGLQYYHSGRDLLEFERNLETFRDFGKPIHITELGIPSSLDPVPKAEYWGGGAGGAAMLWHGDRFTETIQADWIEQMYTIAYSKPNLEAISYWDFADPGFIAHAGFMGPDGTPKESYHRLLALLAKWRSAADASR